MVCMCECFSKILRIMLLYVYKYVAGKIHHSFFMWIMCSTFQRCSNLCRMVCVIINDGHPPTSPLYSKRRSVPWKEARPVWIVSAGTPRISATAIAASALYTLCSPPTARARCATFCPFLRHRKRHCPVRYK